MRAAEGLDAEVSTDLGNLSHRVPVICALLKISGKETGWHSPEVAAATRTVAGHGAMIDGAAGLAMTALDVLLDDGLREQAHRDHAAQMARMGA